jgi:amidase
VTDLCALPAAELVRRVHARDVSRREVLAAHLDRIEAVNPAVNAIVEVRDRDAALAEAEAADRDHDARKGLLLDGVPVSIKDHFDVEGMTHTEGVRAFAERRSPGTALAVQRLVDAGAFVVGKANQPDFQIRWNTVNDLYGATRNPRDLALSAGGSSGGDAAAVAAGMAAIGLGADYGGSIRVPASRVSAGSSGCAPRPVAFRRCRRSTRARLRRQPT